MFYFQQMGIQKGRVKPDEFKLKVENIINKLGIPVQVLILYHLVKNIAKLLSACIFRYKW